MFSKLKALVDYANNHSAIAKKRKIQLQNEAYIDAKLQQCPKQLQLDYLYAMRILNRTHGVKGYSLDIANIPEHIVTSFEEIDKIQAIMLQKKCICLNAQEALKQVNYSAPSSSSASE